MDQVFDKLNIAALAALDDYMAYRAYQGTNPESFQRAKLGMPVLSTYGRVRATRANERALDMMARRASGEMATESQAALEPPTAQQDEPDQKRLAGSRK